MNSLKRRQSLVKDAPEATSFTPTHDELPTYPPVSPLQTGTSALNQHTPNYAPPSPIKDMPALPSASPFPTRTVHQQPTPKYVPNSPLQEKLYLIDRPADDSYMPTPSPKLLRYKAKALLINGNMPLFLSAQRDWKSVD
ncbi:hypothetical protein DPMN_118486 [Dreissena polymorpha]|uniref:Uncharacterized protein n=1 Tax=Dreissena polymorpha TaxID=45954 RepID=A0A9D4GGI9_DREPO|nr:hypothetical protein DPMN_118486 [Dreissena polymorpha]